MNTELSSKQIAEYTGKSARFINKSAASGNWPCRVINKRGDRRFCVDDLPDEYRLACMARQTASMPTADEEPVSVSPQRELFPAKASKGRAVTERKQSVAMAKADLLRLYLGAVRRAGRGKKVAAREQFMRAYNSGVAFPELYSIIGKASWKTVEGWKRSVKKSGDTLTLADRRGMWRKGQRVLSPENKEILLRCALHPNQPMVSEAIRMAWDVMHARGIPNGHSEATYRRWLKSWIGENYHIWTFSREGAKAWNDKCAFSISRDYSLINVGDILVADGHVLNFEIINPWTGKPKRMTLLLWYDMKSSYPCGWEIMPTENTACIASALRRAILQLGKVPKVAYLDNGKAFASRHFNGADLEQAGFSGLFERLGMKTIFAWPYHGQSKTIERFFGTFAELERWAPTYVGTCIDKKPPRMMRGERIHRALHEKATGGAGITLEQAHRAVAAWFDSYAARSQRGHLAGASPQEVFLNGRGPGVDPAELRYMMLAVEGRTIRSNGIHIFGQDYYHPALYGRRHPVTVRYDLQDLSSIIVEHDGELLCEARVPDPVHPAASILGTDADRERLSEQIALKKRQEKEASALARELLENEILPDHQRRMESIAGPGDAVPEKPAAPIAKRLTAADEKRITAEADRMIADNAGTFDQARPLAAPEADAAAFFASLDGMDDVARYEHLLAAEVRGWMMPSRWEAFMAYFEQTPAFTAREEWWEERKARLMADVSGGEVAV